MQWIHFMMKIIYFTNVLFGTVYCSQMNIVKLDVLSPFLSRESMEAQRKKHIKDNYVETITPNQMFMSHSVNTFRKTVNDIDYYGHHAIIFNSKTMLSVLEPSMRGGCSYRKTDTVVKSSKQKDCFVAVNAGFYNQKTGECYGNVISDRLIVNTYNGKKSVGFGIKENGQIVVGYFFDTDLYKNSFKQMISGIGWILRNGESYAEESFEDEKCNLNNIDAFFKLKSSRTFIGHDSSGFVHIVQVDGKTLEKGINLFDAADLLKSFGLINAINLNGGGASTFVVNKTVVNYPSNVCETNGHEVLCSANVSTILCVHLPDECEDNSHCNNHGQCEQGLCFCEKEWSGKYCDEIKNLTATSICCWMNYYWIIALASVAGLSTVFSIFICNLLLMYRSRYLDLAYPKERNTGDQLRLYLKNNHYLTSSNDESSNEVT